MAKKKKLLKDTRIYREEKRLLEIYKNIDEDQLGTVEGLINRASYMRATLEDMEEDLDENGFVEMFSQSEHQEPYERERPVARIYNSLNGNYRSIIKQLSDLLPKEPPKTEVDEFDSFIRKGEDL